MSEKLNDDFILAPRESTRIRIKKVLTGKSWPQQLDSVYTRVYSPRGPARDFGKIESLPRVSIELRYVRDTVGFANATRLSALAAIQMRRVARIAEGTRRAQRPLHGQCARASCVNAKWEKELAPRNCAL